MNLNFIAGLPRAGSTLLAAILRQNPRFRAGMSSPLAGIVRSLHNSLGAQNEFAHFLTDAQRERVLRGVFENFYADVPNDAVIFDTNRTWPARLAMLNSYFPDSKIICCVRHPVQIVTSFERLLRTNFATASRMFNNDDRQNVYTRTEALLRSDRMLGGALNALKEGYYSEQSRMMLIVEYDILVNQPKRTLELIYEFLEEAAFEHDFDNVEYSAAEYDRSITTQGLHDIHGPVTPRERVKILPPDIIRQLERHAFWIDERNPRVSHIVPVTEQG